MTGYKLGEQGTDNGVWLIWVSETMCVCVQGCRGRLMMWEWEDWYLVWSVKGTFLRFIFIYLFGCVSLGYSMWDLVPWPGIKPGPPALEAWTLSFWTTREVPKGHSLNSGILVLSDQSSQFAQDQGVSWDIGPFSANMEMFVFLEQIGVLSHSTWGNECFPPPKAFLFWSCQKWLRPMPINQPTNNCFWKLSLLLVLN